MRLSRYFTEGHMALAASALLALALFVPACTPGLLSALGFAAPVAVAAIDAYTAHAQTIAPGLPADSPLIQALAAALARDSACRVAVLAPVPDAGPSEAALLAQALEASALAAHELAVAIAAAKAAAPSPLPSSSTPFATATPSPTTDAGAP